MVIIMMIIMIIKRMARWQEHPSNEKDAVNIGHGHVVGVLCTNILCVCLLVLGGLMAEV